MLTCEVTNVMVDSWKSVFDEYKTKLEPNRKSPLEIVEYLKRSYPVFEVTNKRWRNVIAKNVLLNDYFANKLPNGKKPEPMAFQIDRRGAGAELYETQDEVFAGQSIYVGVDMASGYILVEGSSRLYDELFAFRGLDDEDIANFYLVAQYIECAKRYSVN